MPKHPPIPADAPGEDTVESRVRASARSSHPGIGQADCSYFSVPFHLQVELLILILIFTSLFERQTLLGYPTKQT